MMTRALALFCATFVALTVTFAFAAVLQRNGVVRALLTANPADIAPDTVTLPMVVGVPSVVATVHVPPSPSETEPAGETASIAVIVAPTGKIIVATSVPESVPYTPRTLTALGVSDCSLGLHHWL